MNDMQEEAETVEKGADVIASIKGTVVDVHGDHVKLRLSTGSHMWISLNTATIKEDK